jgi:hypothetical protein
MYSHLYIGFHLKKQHSRNLRKAIEYRLLQPEKISNPHRTPNKGTESPAKPRQAHPLFNAHSELKPNHLAHNFKEVWDVLGKKCFVKK